MAFRFVIRHGLGAVLSCLFAASLATATTWVVDPSGGGDATTIQQGVDLAAVGDTVLVRAGVYEEQVTIDRALTVTSESGAEATTIDSSGTTPCVRSTGIGVVVEGFTLTNSGGLGVGLLVLGVLAARDCVIRDMDGVHGPGGLLAHGDTTLFGCRFENCRGERGGAIYHANGRLEMYGCYVHDCGSVAMQLAGNFEPPEESAWIEDCRFEDNWNNAGGGGALGIGQYAGGVTIRGCVFENNEDRGTGGGGIDHGYIGQGSVIENCLFLNNRTIGGNGVGGGVSAGGAVTVRGCTFWGNYATTVGDAVGFFAAGSSLENNVIVHCTGPGGAIYLGRNMTLQSSCNVFWDNPGGLGGRYTPGPTDRIVDPLFCDPVGGDFRVATGSPCLPEGSIGCGLIGAFGEGCGVVAVDPTSWGKVKAAYRGGGVGR